MQQLIQSFEGLIRRGIAPSMTLFVLIALGDLIRVEVEGGSVRAQLQGYLLYAGDLTLLSSPAFVPLLLLLTLGVSYALMTLQQLVFDNWLKRNFTPWVAVSPSVASEARALEELRSRVKTRLQQERVLGSLHNLEEVTDYILYEILGGIDPTDTRPFVDSAKSMGIVLVSVILVLLGNTVAYCRELGLWVVLLLLLALLFYVWGRQAIVAQFRMRALRLYVNFLAMPQERLQRRLLRPEEALPPGSPNRT